MWPSTRFYARRARQAQRPAVFRGRDGRDRCVGRAGSRTAAAPATSATSAPCTAATYSGRDVCSPAHVLMNASFVVQGIGMMVGAMLLSSAVIGVAARPGHGSPRTRAGARRRLPAFIARALTTDRRRRDRDRGAGARGRRLPRGITSAPLMYFAAGGLALVLIGWLWRRQTPLGWFILACGAVSLAALDHRRRHRDGRPRARHPGTADGLPDHHRHGGGGSGRGPAGAEGAATRKRARAGAFRPA